MSADDYQHTITPSERAHLRSMYPDYKLHSDGTSAGRERAFEAVVAQFERDIGYFARDDEYSGWLVMGINALCRNTGYNLFDPTGYTGAEGRTRLRGEVLTIRDIDKKLLAMYWLARATPVALFWVVHKIEQEAIETMRFELQEVVEGNSTSTLLDTRKVAKNTWDRFILETRAGFEKDTAAPLPGIPTQDVLL